MPGSALLSDALDDLGRRDQCLRPGLLPLAAGVTISGRALPLTLERPEAIPPVRYAGLLKAMDAVAPGDVVVVSDAAAGGAVALWGELLSTMAMARGAAGAVCDGCVRDVAALRALGFPVAARGAVPLDVHGRLEVVAHGRAIVLDGVRIAPGDLIVADDDGVIVVPADLEEEVVAAATAKASAEDGLRDDVRGGMLPSEAFAKHRVL